MAFTYTSLSTTICDYMQQYDTTFLAELPTMIRQAEDRILKALNIPAFKKNATSTCTQAVRFLSAPTDMLSAFALTLIAQDGTYTPLIFRESSLIYEMWGGNTQGQPQYYSLYNDGTFLIGPTPDFAYQVEFQYFYKPPSIVDAGTSWLGTNAENCLLYACLVEAYNFQKGDQQLMQAYQASFVQALGELKRLGEGLNERDSYSNNDPSINVETKSG